jgi:hypothetical protein
MDIIEHYLNDHISCLEEGGSTAKATHMERVIVAAAGGPAFETDLIDNADEVGKKIVNGLKLTGKASMSDSIYPATKSWHSYFPGGSAKGSTLTPKTDFIIGGKRISLKTGGTAQLMSGGKPEATATFWTAAKNSGAELDATVNRVGEHLEDMLESTNMANVKGGVKGNKTTLRQQGKFAEIEVLKKADNAHHAFKQDLKKVFDGLGTYCKT